MHEVRPPCADACSCILQHHFYLYSVCVVLQHSTFGMPSKTKGVHGDSSRVTTES